MTDEEWIEQLYRRLEEVCTPEFYKEHGRAELTRQRNALIWELRVKYNQTYAKIARSARVSTPLPAQIVKKMNEQLHNPMATLWDQYAMAVLTGLQASNTAGLDGGVEYACEIATKMLEKRREITPFLKGKDQ